MRQLLFYLSMVLIFSTYILSHASTDLQNFTAWMSRFTDWIFLFPPCFYHYEKQLVCIFYLCVFLSTAVFNGEIVLLSHMNKFFLYLPLAVLQSNANMIKTILRRNTCLIPFISLQRRNTQHFSKFPVCTLFQELCGSQLKKFWCFIFQKKTFPWF